MAPPVHSLTLPRRFLSLILRLADASWWGEGEPDPNAEPGAAGTSRGDGGGGSNAGGSHHTLEMID